MMTLINVETSPTPEPIRYIHAHGFRLSFQTYNIAFVATLGSNDSFFCLLGR